jgi:uncharacterized DUF497 family protein
VLEWDEEKARTNIEKHGVSFEEAATCFDDTDVLMFHDVPHSGEEDRYIAIAKTSGGKLLTMVFTVRRDPNGEKIYRLISARQASKKERKVYLR